MVPDKSLGKFWPDLEISEAYLMGLVVSSSGDFVSWNLKEKNLSFYNPTFTCM